MYSRFFCIKELVAPEILNVLTDSAAWRLIPSVVIFNLDNLRNDFGEQIIINGNGLTHCGVRPKQNKNGEAFLSRHKLLVAEITAFDLHSKNLQKLREFVEYNFSKYGICAIENENFTPEWIHVEFSTQKVFKLKKFDPVKK